MWYVACFEERFFDECGSTFAPTLEEALAAASEMFVDCPLATHVWVRALGVPVFCVVGGAA